MGEFRRAARLQDIPPPERGGLRVWVDGIPVGLFRWEGQVYAIEDVCTHEETPLTEGWVEGGAVHCPRHGARFDLHTGRALSLPAVLPVRVFEVRVEGDDVYVRI